jgi:hypothetical protein
VPFNPFAERGNVFSRRLAAILAADVVFDGLTAM